MDKVINFVKNVINNNINKKDIVSCDMTCGRGNDTLYLADFSKKVYLQSE